MNGFFRRIFHLYPGEGRRALPFVLLAFLASLALIGGEKFSEALFLLHVGADSFPQVYTYTALVSMVMAAVLLYAYHRFSASSVFMVVMLAAAAFYGGVLACFVTGFGVTSTTFWFVLQVVSYVFFINLLTSFWSFIDQYHHLQDAKRLYALFSSAIFLGIATTGGIINLGVLNVTGLFAGIVALCLLSAAGIAYIGRSVDPMIDEIHTEGTEICGKLSWRAFGKAILSSRLAMLVLASDLICQLLWWITEYNYMWAFEQKFAPADPIAIGTETTTALTLFIGKCVFTVGILNIILGLFVYSRLVKRFGVNNMEGISPFVLMLVFLCWPLSGSLFLPLMGYMVVEGLNFAIDDNNFNLLLNAIPTKVKYKFRVVVEWFFEPLGMLIIGPTLSILGQNSRWLGAALAAVAIVIAIGIRKNYIRGILVNLRENALHFSRSTSEWWSTLTEREITASKKRMIAALDQRDPEAQKLACKALIAYGDEGVIHRILPKIGELPAATKIYFLKQIENTPLSSDGTIIEALETWMMEDPDPSLRSAILFHLAREGLLHPDKLRYALGSSDLKLRGAALLALQTATSGHSPAHAAQNRTTMAQHLQDLLDDPRPEAKMMAITLLGIEAAPHNIDIVLPYLKDADANIVRAAAEALVKILEAHDDCRHCLRFSKPLTTTLTTTSDTATRLACLRALGAIGDSSTARDIIAATLHFRPSERRAAEAIVQAMGLKTVPTLLKITRDRTVHPRCRIVAGRILGKLAPPQLRANLYKIVETEINFAYFYFYHSHRIQQQHPESDLHLLEDALNTSYHSTIDFIIQMLGVAGSLPDPEVLSWGLRSQSQKARSQAIETIEKTCPPRILRILEPLISEAPIDEKLRVFLDRGGIPLQLHELLDALEISSNHIDNIVSAALKRRFNAHDWKNSLKKQMIKNHALFHRFAFELLEDVSSREPARVNHRGTEARRSIEGNEESMERFFGNG